MSLAEEMLEDLKCIMSYDGTTAVLEPKAIEVIEKHIAGVTLNHGSNSYFPLTEVYFKSLSNNEIVQVPSSLEQLFDMYDPIHERLGISGDGIKSGRFVHFSFDDFERIYDLMQKDIALDRANNSVNFIRHNMNKEKE